MDADSLRALAAAHPRCATCAHWTPDEDRWTLPPGWRLCAVSGNLFEKVDWERERDLQRDTHIALRPEFERITAGAQDGSDYMADLVTAPGHYCAMHSALA